MVYRHECCPNSKTCEIKMAMLTPTRGSLGVLNPRQRTRRCWGISRTGEMVFSRKNTAIGYPVLNDQLWKHKDMSNIILTEDVVFIYSVVCICVAINNKKQSYVWKRMIREQEGGCTWENLEGGEKREKWYIITPKLVEINKYFIKHRRKASFI